MLIGRAGRVCNGRVYRLITRQFWDNHICEYSTPEMQVGTGIAKSFIFCGSCGDDVRVD